MPAFPQKKRPLHIAAVFDHSGREKSSGAGLFQGSSAYFAALNRAGGIRGTQVELMQADDQFTPELARQHARKFAADRAVVALLHPVGTRQVDAVMAAAPGLAVVGPYTGTVSLRHAAARSTFWLRASYDQKVDKLVNTASVLGIPCIGIVYPDDALGNSVREGFKATLARARLEPAIMARTSGTTSTELGHAAWEIAAASPQVVIVALAGTAPAFVRALRQAGGTSIVYGLSIAASAHGLRELGDLAHGLGFSVVVPSPFVTRYQIVRRYQADMLASGHQEFSLPSLEGYIDACVLARGLRRVGPDPSRAAVISALESIRGLDLGGVRIGFGKGRREGNPFVDGVVINSRGRMTS